MPFASRYRGARGLCSSPVIWEPGRCTSPPWPPTASPAPCWWDVSTTPGWTDSSLGSPGERCSSFPKGVPHPGNSFKALQAGRAVVMVADQDAGPRGTFAPFFGRLVSTLPLPGALVARYRTPLFLMVGFRLADGGHRVQLTALPQPDEGEEEQLRRAVAGLCNAALEEAIRQHPEQYFWYHRRFRHYPERTAPTGARQSGAS
ncbi:MAG: lysophospholipid acyltransferase family protein [Thermoanaerobaculum sp.]|nr:lysophospholipid acyltransferase family protein [Thermoanaerobaculum sp.]